MRFQSRNHTEGQPGIHMPRNVIRQYASGAHETETNGQRGAPARPDFDEVRAIPCEADLLEVAHRKPPVFEFVCNILFKVTEASTFDLQTVVEISPAGDNAQALLR